MGKIPRIEEIENANTHLVDKYPEAKCILVFFADRIEGAPAEFVLTHSYQMHAAEVPGRLNWIRDEWIKSVANEN